MLEFVGNLTYLAVFNTSFWLLLRANKIQYFLYLLVHEKIENMKKEIKNNNKDFRDVENSLSIFSPQFITSHMPFFLRSRDRSGISLMSNPP